MWWEGQGSVVGGEARECGGRGSNGVWWEGQGSVVGGGQGSVVGGGRECGGRGSKGVWWEWLVHPACVYASISENMFEYGKITQPVPISSYHEQTHVHTANT